MFLEYKEMSGVLKQLLTNSQVNSPENQSARSSKITYKEVTEATGIHATTISYLLNGRRIFNYNHVNKLSVYFDVPVERFLFPSVYSNIEISLKTHSTIDPTMVNLNLKRITGTEIKYSEFSTNLINKIYDIPEADIDSNIPVLYFAKKSTKPETKIRLASSYKTISRWYNGTGIIKLGMINVIADVLDVSAYDLLF